ncbi:FAD-dependent oxidoreductase [Leucobacter sp. W1038]|uniref:FAD-dependent oxidoreductase n=1 Tax=Leucobacter sp. W1038 TaxID=3438281 RepID=UPI003D96773C
MRVVVGEPGFIFDVIVIGSGASGLSSAAVAAQHGLSVLVVEKGELIGGTSAVSGGMVWVPNSRQLGATELADSSTRAEEYVRAVARGRGNSELMQTVVEEGAVALTYFEDECGLDFAVLDDFPDYRQDLPGAAFGGRTLEPKLWDSTNLGPLVDMIRTDGRAPFTMQEYERWGAFTQFPWDELNERAARGITAKGLALIGGLLASCVQNGVTVALDAAAESLAVGNTGRVTGVILTDGTSLTARHGVVIASGGFEWDHELTDSLLASRLHAVCSPPTNTGDGLRMAQRIGAMTRGTREAWWAPMSITGDTRDGAAIGTLLRFERQGPGSIMVNSHGQRFANESQNYNDLARALHSWDPANNASLNTPAYVIVDSRYLELYGLFSHRFGEPTPDYLTEASNLRNLAIKLGMPPANLEDTVERFNEFAIAGVDSDFSRGESAYDQYWGDHNNPWPNSSLAPLAVGPFYALPVVNGAFGTNGGIATDGHGRVKDVDGEWIEGLYALGNATQSAYASGYPGAGATLGPIITLGYLVGKELAQEAQLSR